MKVSASQMAGVIGVSRQSVIRWCNLGLLGQDAQLIGGRWIINWHDYLFDGSPLIRWLDPEFVKSQPKRLGRPVGSKDFSSRTRARGKKYKRRGDNKHG